MANSFVRYTGNGSTTAYSVPFSYRAQADVAITIDGVATTAFTWDGAGTTVTFTTAPLNLTSIEIRRTTSQAARLVDYADGSVLKENDLDTDSFQGFYMGQEAIDDANDRILLDAADFQWNAQSKRIKSVADPTAAQDAVTLNYLTSTYLTTATIAHIATLGAIASDISTVAGISANVTAVAGDATDIGVVAGKATEIGRLGTADAVTDMNTLATADIVTDMNVLATGANVTAMGLLGTSANVTAMGLLGTSDAIADMNTLATSDIVSDLNTLATSGIVDDLNILATSANVTNMATLGASGVVGDIETVADNITNVSNFANRYRISTNDPSTSLDAGDLAYVSSANALKFYDGSSWTAITTDTDVKTNVSANDTTAGYLNGKLVAGEAVTFTENSDGGNETLTIAATDPTPLAIALG